MSDRWDFYFCTVDSEPASIFVDLGLAKGAPKAPLVHIASVRIRLTNPRQDGLSGADEASVLKLLEDRLDDEVKTSAPPGVFVGRSTSGGNRDFFFYIPSPDGWASRISAVMKTFQGYKFEADVWEDRNSETYFEFLLPNEEQKQTMENRRVCEQLEARGDTLGQPRVIDHWVYFPQSQQRNEFQARSAQMGFLTRRLLEEPAPHQRYGIQIYRVDLPSYDVIDDVTLPLFWLAREFGGEYDGWETVVVEAD